MNKMIIKAAADRITDLGETIAGDSQELEQLVCDFLVEADDQLARAAAAFVTRHTQTTKGHFWSYNEQREALCEAVVAASNIDGLRQLAETVRKHSSSWTLLKKRGQRPDYLRQVCNKAGETAGAADVQS